jgi:dihydrofolate reductase
MRKIVASTFLSLDGVMQAPGGPDEDPSGGFKFGGWVFPYSDEVTGGYIGKLFDQPFELLLGRTTYDIFAAYWPYAGEDHPIAKPFNSTTKYVATSSREPLSWQNSVALHDVPADLARLKQQDGPMLLIQGSSVLIQSLLKHGLIDEITLLIFPIVLGVGKRLFDEDSLPAAFELVDSKVSSTGVVIASYRRAGAIRTGSFAHAEPSQAELERRARMAAKH